MNNTYLYLISEELYKHTSSNSLCNRNWLFSIYKSLLVSNGINNEPIIWTKYNQWKIDHNCRAAKSTAKSDGTVLVDFILNKIDDDKCLITGTFHKKNKTETGNCNYCRSAFPSGLWMETNPNGQTVLLSEFECDQLFESSIADEYYNSLNNHQGQLIIDNQVQMVETNLSAERVITEANLAQNKPADLSAKKKNNKQSPEDLRDKKFLAIHLLLEQIRDQYHQNEDEQQRSFIEVVIGAAIFYLPCLNEHFCGYISLAAVKGYLKGQRRVKDHIYPRKLAARELLAMPMTVEGLKSRYHDHLAQYMYVTSTENSLLVNFYEVHDDHDLALNALQIQKFPQPGQDKFKSHKELNNFLAFLEGKNIQSSTIDDLSALLKEYRAVISA